MAKIDLKKTSGFQLFYDGENLQSKDLSFEGKIEVAIKMGEGGRAFGSVSSKEIAEEVKKQMDLTIDKKKVQLKEAIRTLGTHTVPVKLHPKVTAELKVVVKEEAYEEFRRGRSTHQTSHATQHRSRTVCCRRHAYG